MGKGKPKRAAILTSKIVLVLGIVILIFFSISLVKEIVRKAEIDNEIAELEKEIEELESTNTELADLIQYLNSTSWQEKEARSKLNLQKPGEGVIAILDLPTNGTEIEETVNTEETSEENVSNPTKWFKYFFE